MPVYIVTNNTRPHLNKIFDCLRGSSSQKDLSAELGVYVITVESTLEYNPNLGHETFYPKQMRNQFVKLCDKIKKHPSCVGVLDDTERICRKAEKQGLIPISTTGPAETKQNLSELYKMALTQKINEKCQRDR